MRKIFLGGTKNDRLGSNKQAKKARDKSRNGKKRSHPNTKRKRHRIHFCTIQKTRRNPLPDKRRHGQENTIAQTQKHLNMCHHILIYGDNNGKHNIIHARGDT